MPTSLKYEERGSKISPKSVKNRGCVADVFLSVLGWPQGTEREARATVQQVAPGNGAATGRPRRPAEGGHGDKHKEATGGSSAHSENPSTAQWFL